MFEIVYISSNIFFRDVKGILCYRIYRVFCWGDRRW